MTFITTDRIVTAIHLMQIILISNYAGLNMSFQKEAQNALKRSGGRLTDQRNLVIRLLANSSQRIDAESLYLLAHQEDESISLATVYRTLNALADAGVIHKRYLSPDHSRQYFERTPEEQILYITCRDCQKSMPITTNLLAELKEELHSNLNWRDVNVCTCLSGLCDACAKLLSNESEGEI